MASITSSGFGSGIDINGLLQQLIAAERAPTQARLNRREALVQTQLTAINTVQGSLASFRTAVTALDADASFRARSVASAAPSIASASATASAPTGSYQVEVQQLATAHKLRSNGFSSDASVVGQGTLTISAGGKSFSLGVDASGHTLADIRDAINAAADNVIVSASIVRVDDGLGGSVSRLILSAREAGSAAALTVTVDDEDGDDTDAAGLSQLAYDTVGGAVQLEQIVAAADALIEVDGQPVTRSSNRITDVIDGVTLELKQADPGNVFSVSVSANNAVAGKSVRDFVKAYNDFYGPVAGFTRFDADTGAAGVLIGDASVRGLVSRLRGELGAFDRRAVTGYGSLAELGISTGRDGRLSIDESRLELAIAGNVDAVQRFFAGDGGLSARLDGLLGGFLGEDGSLAARRDGLRTRIDDLSRQRSALDLRLEALESRLQRQFIAMDTLVASLRNTGEQLLGSLESLNKRRSD